MQKRNERKNIEKGTRGITLIALVVTIVVLIILATISINAVMGENGLIRQAEKAREHQVNAEKSDNEAMDELDKHLANTIGEEDITPPEKYAYSFEAGDNITAYVIENEEESTEDGKVYDMLFIGEGEMYRIDRWNTEGLIDVYMSSGVYVNWNISVKSVKIAKGITNIADYAFARCSELTSITIPSSVTSIGYRAFFYCANLTSITIPEGVTSIGDEAFYHCANLTSITIPEGVTSIGDMIFYQCKSLTSITIPVSVISIEYYAFGNCSELTSIEYEGTKEQWNKITLGTGWKYGVPTMQVVCSDGSILF